MFACKEGESLRVSFRNCVGGGGQKLGFIQEKIGGGGGGGEVSASKAFQRACLPDVISVNLLKTCVVNKFIS